MLSSYEMKGLHPIQSKPTFPLELNRKVFESKEDDNVSQLMKMNEFGGASTASSSNGDLVSSKPKKNARPTIQGCPFFSVEQTDPIGKNLTQGYP